MKRILLVEDDANVREPLARFLRSQSIEVLEAENLRAAEAELLKQPLVVVLDWSLPDGQGVDLVRTWREKGVTIPIILLTARAELIDKVMGLESGANDYLTKPFEPRELLARIRAQLRASSEEPAAKAAQKTTKPLRLGDLEMDLDRRDVRYGQVSITLKKLEFELLKLFMENPDRVFTREELLNQVWGYDNYPSTRTVDNHILQLRQKIRDDLFDTLRGVGYRLRSSK